MRRDAKLHEGRVIGLYRFNGSYFAIGNSPEKLDKNQRLLGKIDLPSEQRRARSMLLGIMEELEGITGRSCASTHNAHDDARIISDEFFQCRRSVVGDFQEKRPPRRGDSRKRPYNMIVYKTSHIARRNSGTDIGVEDLQKIAEMFFFSLAAESGELHQCPVVRFEVICESERIESKVCADVGQRAVFLQPAILDVLDGC